LRAVGVVFAATALLWTFRDTDPQRVASLLRRVGGAGLLIVIPQFLSLFVESVGWKLAFERMGQVLPLSGLLRVRLATEALAQTLPVGTVFCESMKPLLLGRNCGADLSTSLSGMAARKWLLVSSQSVYVAVFGLLGFATLTRISPQVLGTTGLPQLVLAAALLLVLLALGGYSVLAQGRIASRMLAWLQRLPSAWLRTRLAPLGSRFERADGQLRTFFTSAGGAPSWSWLAFLMGWLLEAADTLLILALLGVHLPWTTVGALEVSASFVRNVAFVVPAGLGVQDVSYLAFLRALDVPDALNVAAAFLLLKRCKECFWALCGYAVLAMDLRPLPPARTVEQTC
jgi:hypothetical protein